MAVIALIVAIVSAIGTVGSLVVSQVSIKHVRKQADLALRQIHVLRTPEWGEVELESGAADSWTVNLPLVSDTPLDSVRLVVLVDPGQTAGLYLQSEDEGAAGGLELGANATWRLGLNQHGDPTTRVRITSTAGEDNWSVLIDLPLSVYAWRDITTLG